MPFQSATGINVTLPSEVIVRLPYPARLAVSPDCQVVPLTVKSVTVRVSPSASLLVSNKRPGIPIGESSRLITVQWGSVGALLVNVR